MNQSRELGNRSALEWVIDQYRVSTCKRSGITNDPNRNDPEYILRLIGQVITVSLETVKVVNALPDLGRPQTSDTKTAAAIQSIFCRCGIGQSKQFGSS